MVDEEKRNGTGIASGISLCFYSVREELFNSHLFYQEIKINNLNRQQALATLRHHGYSYKMVHVKDNNRKFEFSCSVELAQNFLSK